MTPRAPVQQEAFSLGETARRLGVSCCTVRRAVARGQLAAFRVGRVLRVWGHEIERWTEATAARAKQAPPRPARVDSARHRQALADLRAMGVHI